MANKKKKITKAAKFVKEMIKSETILKAADYVKETIKSQD